MRILIVLLLTFLISSPLQAQTTLAEKQTINQFSQKANQIILHINTNISQLKLYQNQLNAWYLDKNQTIATAPVFSFKQVYIEKEITDMVANNKTPLSNPVFNYKSTLIKLNQQVSLFNAFCKEMQKLPKVGTKDDFYKNNMVFLYQIDNISFKLVDYCYDFSLSCAVNFGKEVLPLELEHLKNLVGQSKNVIMAIRQNSTIQVKSYLKQLDDAIYLANTNNNFNDLKIRGKFTNDEASIKEMHAKVLHAANLIAYWADQYLQSNQSDEEVLQILESAILSFNALDGNLACASAYNNLVSKSTQSYLMFTEEPMFFSTLR